MAGDGYQPVTFADPESVHLGDDVIAIGFALGLDGDPSVTLGIVSALDRTIGTDGAALDGLIQTDAAISSATPVARSSTPRAKSSASTPPSPAAARPPPRPMSASPSP